MSKDTKTAPAAPGNPAVRVWPPVVNEHGIVLDAPIIIERGSLKGKPPVQLQVTAALIFEGGVISAVLGVSAKKKDGTGSSWAPGIEGERYSSPERMLVGIESAYKIAGLPWTEAEACSCRFDIESELIEMVKSQAEALNITESVLLAWIEDGKQPAGAEEKKPRVMAQQRRSCRWVFTPAEREDLAKRQAEANQKCLTLEEDRKRVQAQYKADIESAAGQRDELGRKVISGYEFRDMPCTLFADTPERGKKSWIRDDTGEVVDTVFMTGSDLQEVLKLDDQRKKPAPEPEPKSSEEGDDEEGDSDNE